MNKTNTIMNSNESYNSHKKIMWNLKKNHKNLSSF